jgi:hypothetical protein
MKIGMFTLLLTVVSLVGALALAQDTGRVPDINRDVSAIDNSARLDADELPKQAPPSQSNRKSMPYSRWSLQPTGEAPRSQFGAPAKAGDPSTAANSSSQIGMQPSASTTWSHRAADSGTARPGPSQKGDEHQTPFEGLARGRQRNGSIGSNLFDAYLPLPSPNSQTDQLSTLSHEKPFGQDSIPLFSGVSRMGHPMRSKTSKSHTKSAERRRSTGGSLASSAAK